MRKINHGNIHEKSRVRLNTQEEHWPYSRSSREARRKWSSHGRRWLGRWPQGGDRGWGRCFCSIISRGQKSQLRIKGSLARNPHVSSSMAVASQMGSCRGLDQFWEWTGKTLCEVWLHKGSRMTLEPLSCLLEIRWNWKESKKVRFGAR